MSMQSVTFEASEESIATLDEIASNRGVDRDEILREAVDIYLAEYEQLKADLEEADRQIEAGDFLTHEQVVAKFEDRVRAAKAA